MEDTDQSVSWGSIKRWRVFLVFGTVVLVIVLVVSLLPSGAIDKELVGDYRLLGPDDENRLSVVRDEGDGLVVQRVPDVVIHVGWDDDYITASCRDPQDTGGTLFYYYIDMVLDSGPTRDGVVGPLSKEEFEVAKETFGLPDFTLYCPDLR